ncbi:hypothetical protein [Paenibacillus illinoisensis]|uniref:hypothetical protein n=1 Tax=Paenibacillus illinoisensis TaxID=59845 RepID=UPI003D2A9320
MVKDQTSFPDFYEAADELDDLIRDGLFGEEAIQNLNKRDLLSIEDYLVQIFDEWISNDNQVGKDKVKILVVQFVEFFADVIKEKPQETIDILSGYWTGTADNPELEGMSGHTEAMRFHREAIIGAERLKYQENKTSADLKRVAGAFITAYSKVVEHVGQILVPCIKIAFLKNQKDFNENQILRLTLNDKIEKFNLETSNSYFALNDLINRTIRNADSHLSIKYSVSKRALEYKKRYRGKTQIFSVPLEKWMFEIYPKPGWFVQAFIYSSILVCLGVTNPSLFKIKYEGLFV